MVQHAWYGWIYIYIYYCRGIQDMHLVNLPKDIGSMTRPPASLNGGRISQSVQVSRQGASVASLKISKCIQYMYVHVYIYIYIVYIYIYIYVYDICVYDMYVHMHIISLSIQSIHQCNLSFYMSIQCNQFNLISLT